MATGHDESGLMSTVRKDKGEDPATRPGQLNRSRTLAHGVKDKQDDKPRTYFCVGLPPRRINMSTIHTTNHSFHASYPQILFH
jgi:hypothetical protein